MRQTRFSVALETGLIHVPPDGAFGVLNPAGDVDLSFLPQDRLLLSQSFFPDHNSLRHRGFSVTPTPLEPAAGSLVFCHRSKQATLDLIAQATALTDGGGIVAVEGNKSDGVESIAKALKRRFDPLEVYAKSHGKLLWFTRPDPLPDLSDWQARAIDLPENFTSWPGVFSCDGIDKGSRLLATHLPELGGRVADFGAGWGYLSRLILRADTVHHLDLIEADYHALEAARRNITDARAQFHWADVTSFTAEKYDAIVTNPPFHVGRAAVPQLGQKFIARAAGLLNHGGQFWMIANRNLPYEHTLQALFGHVETIAQTGGFKIITARRPLRNPKAAILRGQ